MEIRFIHIVIFTLSLQEIRCITIQSKLVQSHTVKKERIDIDEHFNNKVHDDVIYTNNIVDKKDAANIPHSRQKRLLWITNDGRLALPPGSSLVISPTLSLPFVRHPLEGFFSNISISLPLTVDFDTLGLTDNENPYGDLPPFFARSFGQSIGKMVADFLGRHMDTRRGKRNVEQLPRPLQEKAMKVLHGGERVILFGAVEDLLSNFGMNGKSCLLRAICEVHAHPLTNFGLFGELIKLFLTASRSPYSHLLEEYVQAEKAGAGVDGGPGECWPYFKECSKSLFTAKKSKYSEDAEKHHQEDIVPNSNLNSETSNSIDKMHE